jgi:hypothetical protein
VCPHFERRKDVKRVLAVFIGTILLAMTAAVAADSRLLSKKEVKELVAKASTPQDHRKLAGHYEAKAKEYEAEAAEHAEMAKVFRARPTASESKRPGAADTAAHCESMAKSLVEAAKEARAMAVMHEELTKK